MIIKTFKTLQDDVLRWYDEKDNTDEVRDNVKQALAAAHVSRLAARKWSFMQWDEPQRLTTVAGQRAYALHQEFHIPIYFYNVTTQRWMEEITPATLVQGVKEDTLSRYTDGAAAWTDAAGEALRFELRGVQPVKAQPPSASVVTIISSSSSDGASQSVKLRGEASDGSIQEETITVTQSVGLVPFRKILKVTKIGTWAGTLTMTAGGTTLLTLFPTETGRQYRTFYLTNEPSTPETIEYHFYRQPSPLEHDNDIPDIPSPYADVLVYDALIANAAYNPVEGDALKIWLSRQRELEEGLFEAYSQPHSLERAAHYVHYIPR